MSPTAHNKDVLSYNASCNPPRRAKRPRLDAEHPALNAASSSINPRPRPQLLPKDEPPRRLDDSPDQDSSEEEDEYDPGEPAPAPKRRGRKPGPLSRSARESQRKLNHSKIEKARRTKINETLSALSNLVSEAEKQKAIAAGAEHPVAKKETKGEKEFKLDVLVKTVSYIEELIQKINALELKANTCAHCCSATSSSSQPTSSTSARHTSPGVKRKRPDIERDDQTHQSSPEFATSGNAAAENSTRNHSPRSTSHDLPPPPVPNRRFTSASPRLLPMSSSSASPCLPPISSWLPHPYLDPSSISSLPSPDLSGVSLSSMNPSSHLPTPPLSGTFRMPLSHPTQTLPALSLPGPAHPSLSSFPSSSASASISASAALEQKTQDMRITMPSRRLSTISAGKNPALSPTVSPSWTPEDETAASLLLQMSSSPSNSSSGSLAGMTPKIHRKSSSNGVAAASGDSFGVTRQRGSSIAESPKEKHRERILQAETPSSLLGIGVGNEAGGGRT